MSSARVPRTVEPAAGNDAVVASADPRDSVTGEQSRLPRDRLSQPGSRVVGDRRGEEECNREGGRCVGVMMRSCSCVI